MSLETVSDLLGHADYRTTQIYAKIVDAKCSEEMSKWNKLSKRNHTTANIEVYCPACNHLALQIPKGLLNLEHMQLKCPSCQHSFITSSKHIPDL